MIIDDKFLSVVDRNSVFTVEHSKRVCKIGDIEEPGGSSHGKCYNCKPLLDDAKSAVQCTLCKNYYHGKCEEVDFRGFHMRKSTWRCKQYVETHGDGRDAIVGRSRKKSRVDDIIDQSLLEEMNQVGYNTKNNK